MSAVALFNLLFWISHEHPKYDSQQNHCTQPAAAIIIITIIIITIMKEQKKKKERETAHPPLKGGFLKHHPTSFLISSVKT